MASLTGSALGRDIQDTLDSLHVCNKEDVFIVIEPADPSMPVLMPGDRAVLFSNGQRHAVGQVAGAIGKRVLICTDQRFVASPPMNDILNSLKAASADTRIFDGVQPELPSDGIIACVASLQDFKPEAVIGLSGGSCMVMAKLVSVLLTHGDPLNQYYGELKVPGPILPVIAIPTTSGTGSEVTPVAVLGDSERNLKVGVSSPYLIPQYLPHAVANGDDMQARGMLMAGAVSAGLAFGVAGTAVALGASQTNPAQLAEEAIVRVRQLCAEVGIPRTLAELGLKADQLDWVAQQSMLSARLINNNPRPLQVSDIAEIAGNAFHGKLDISTAVTA